QKNLLRRLLNPRGTLRLPGLFLLAADPLLRRILPRLMAFGLWKVRVNSPQSSFSPAMRKLTILLKSLFLAACAVALFGTVTWRPTRRGDVLPDSATPGV